MTDNLTPKAIVAALDEHIIGQQDAKRAVAVALRNRWRRQRLGADLRDEVTPKNILMIGPTGCGKTEISRREQIARDLVEEAIRLEKERRREAVREAASDAAMERLLTALVGDNASEATRASFRQRIVQNAMNDVEVEIEVADGPSAPFDMGNMGGSMQMIDLSDMMGKALGRKATRRQKLRVPDAWDRLVEEEADKRLDQDDVARVALANAETNGIVFLDEIDKIAVSDVRGGSVSREGVQRDLLPLIEGTTVATKHGPMKTDHVLFIASGAFHVAKPSDMLPELQGRLPIRVELRALTEADFVRILSETRANLVAQYKALLGTEDVTLDITEDAVTQIAHIAAQVNASVENIGARRLQTVMERLLEEVSFEAEDLKGETVTIDAAYVRDKLANLAGNTDLSKYIL
ncbi:MAG: HslU--HslV peptidase ATPase subunit [Alphaproteobacteria bacterium HGW-Alphaproteobacteria-14]|nr:MAG: HslU--HslV peptidase ATPase subunit [Alphaproteobacteria bacterium HGW-Alphaproteobacteria-14]